MVAPSDRRLVLLMGLSVAVAACFPTAPNAEEAESPPDVVTAPDREPSPTVEPSPPPNEASEAAAPAPEAEPPSASGSGPSQASGQTTPEPEAIAASTIDVGSFTTEELFALGAGGCGMSLWRAGSDPFQDGFVFFNGLDGTAIMTLDGEMVELERKTATGDEFYGQYISQTFVTPDTALSATTNVVLGEPGEIESVAIPAGTLIVQSNAEVVEMAVVGDAGC